MSTKIRVRHQGITLDITKEKEGRYIVPDYSSGKRCRHVRTTEGEARQQAKQIAAHGTHFKRSQSGSPIDPDTFKVPCSYGAAN